MSKAAPSAILRQTSHRPQGLEVGFSLAMQLRDFAKILAEEVFPVPFQIGELSYNYPENILTTPKREINLTTKENELLKIFFQNVNETVVRSVALKKIWKDDSYFNARSMDVYIAKIRKYLADDPSLKILTIHGEGFKLVEVA